MPLLSDNIRRSVRKLEIDSIKGDREIAFLICDGKYHKLESSWNGESLTAKNLNDTIDKKCKGDVYLGHTHILFTHKPSRDDFILPSNQKIRGICIAGIDGIGCYDRNKHMIEYRKWGARFKTDFINAEGKIWEGHGIYCDGESKYFCEIVDDKERVIPMGIFNMIGSMGGTQILHPYDADFSIETHKANEKIECYAKEGIDTLFCEVKEDEENM